MKRSTLCAGIMLLGATGFSTPVPAETVSFDMPSDDRWNYPFNFTPGSRPIASCFGAAGTPSFNDRDGEMIVAWDTISKIPPSQGTDHYGIRFVRITLTNVKDATWPIDLSADDWFTCDLNQDNVINADGIPRGQPGDSDGESSDADSGRPIELFGAGFGPFYTLQSWDESSLYIGAAGDGDAPRDPFPFVFLENGPERLHVEDNVKGLWNEGLNVLQFTPPPWAIGVPLNYSPGQQAVPFDVIFDVDLGLSGGQVRRYFQEQLDAGRVAVIVTSLREAAMQSAQSGYPSFFTKEGLSLDPGAKAPQLTIGICQAVAPDFDRDCDVDADDLAILSGCLTGPAIALLSPSCAEADFDGDGDVDQSDFGVWQRCFSGSGNAPLPGCDQ